MAVIIPPAADDDHDDFLPVPTREACPLLMVQFFFVQTAFDHPSPIVLNMYVFLKDFVWQKLLKSVEKKCQI